MNQKFLRSDALNSGAIAQLEPRKRHIVSVSGGKDSTYMLFKMCELGLPVDEVVFFDTEWEFPQLYRHMEQIKEYCERRGIIYTSLRAEPSFDYLMFDKPVQERSGGQHNGYSWCGLHGCRWGTTEKLKALEKYCAGHYEYVGLAADELERLEKERSGDKRFPLAEWGTTEAECLAGCYERGYDWEGLYEDLDRVSCMFCGMKNLRELRNVYHKMPGVWQELRDRQSREQRPYKGEGKSVFDLEIRFDLEDERVATGQSITNREFYAELRKRLSDTALTTGEEAANE